MTKLNVSNILLGINCMEFVDNTGHIFSLNEFSEYPNGYLYDESPYVFWMNDKQGSCLSVNCYYIKPVRLLLLKTKSTDKNVKIETNIEIKIEQSSHYKLLSPNIIQDGLTKNDSFLTTDVNIDSATDLTNILSTLSTNKNEEIFRIDLVETRNLIKDNDKTYIFYGEDETLSENIKTETFEFEMIPFYVVGKVSEAGSWLTNVLIHVNETTYKIGNTEPLNILDRYCPITVGGVYYDEFEELEINGKNIGVTLPKDILRAIYSTSFFNETPDMNKWNQKMKEFLMNHMLFLGEKGNFRSIERALNWFEFGNKISIYKLIKTDNDFTNKYILDNFDLTTDIISAFRYFRNSTYISLGLKSVGYDENDSDEFNFENDFWGENKPKLIDYFKQVNEVEFGENKIKYYKPYYDFSFNELALKLSTLQYFYQKYFLPLHIKIFRSSITHQCFGNDIKLLATSNTCLSETPVFNADRNIKVTFNNNFDLYEKIKNSISSLIVYSLDIFSDKTQKTETISFAPVLRFRSNNEANAVFANKERTEVFDIVSLTSLVFDDKKLTTLTKEVKTEYETLTYTYKIKQTKIDTSLNKHIQLNNSTNYMSNNVWMSKQIHFIDENFNEFVNYHEYGEYNDTKILFVDETCFSIPISITSSDENTVFNCIFMLYKDATKILETKFSYSQKQKYNSLVIVPKLFKNVIKWEDSQYHLIINVNGNWYDFDFTVKVPELHISLGKLEYEYDYNVHKQFSGIENGRIKWNSKMFCPELVTIDNIDFVSQITNYAKNTCLQYIDGNELEKDKLFYFYYCENGNKHIISLNDDDKIEEIKTPYSSNSQKIYTLKESENDCRLNCKFFTTFTLNTDDTNKDIHTDYSKNEIDESDEIIIDSEGVKFCEKYNETCNFLFFTRNGLKRTSDIPEGAQIYSSIYKNLSSFVDLYKSNVTVPTNKERMNKVYIYDLYKTIDGKREQVKYNYQFTDDRYDENQNFKIEMGDLEVMYEINGKDDVLNLYKEIFNETGDWEMDLYSLIEDTTGSNWEFSLLNEKHYFDIYLMHDTRFWYVVLISKETIGQNSKRFENLAQTYRIGKREQYIDNNDELQFNDEFSNLFLIKRNAGEKLLINRLNFIDSEGVNQFNDNDLVVCKLRNGDGLQIKSQIGSRWNITPLSFSINDKTVIESNNNMAIISIGDNLKYEPGYYEINVKYSLDNYLNIYRETSTKFRINK